MRHVVATAWRRIRTFRSWLLRDDLGDTYPRKSTEAAAQGPTPDRHVNFNAPPGGGVF